MKRPNVVLLVMDEFPGDSLLDRHRRIDPVRYPNFAALASDATWFRNAYSVYDSTTKAVPLILDGIRPRPGTSADRSDHPHSIYDVFARHGYRVVDSEEASALCPPSICRGARSTRPAIIPNLLGGRPQRFDRWVRSIKSGKPTLWVKHLLLPHGPYLYLPSGERTRPGPADPLRGMNSVPGFHDEFLTRHNEQRYLLQLGFADRLLGRLLRPAQARGHLRRHAGRRHRRPRDRLPGRRADAPQRQPVERRGAHADPADRQATRPAAGPDQRRLRPHPGRHADDRGHARLEAGLPRRRALGLRPGHRAAAQRHAHDARLLLDRPHLRRALGGAPRRRGAAPPEAVRLRRARLAVHRHRPAPRADRPAGAGGGAGLGARRAGRSRGCSRTSTRGRAWCRPRSRAT